MDILKKNLQTFMEIEIYNHNQVYPKSISELKKIFQQEIRQKRIEILLTFITTNDEMQIDNFIEPVFFSKYSALKYVQTGEQSYPIDSYFLNLWWSNRVVLDSYQFKCCIHRTFNQCSYSIFSENLSELFAINLNQNDVISIFQAKSEKMNLPRSVIDKIKFELFFEK